VIVEGDTNGQKKKYYGRKVKQAEIATRKAEGGLCEREAYKRPVLLYPGCNERHIANGLIPVGNKTASLLVGRP